jgi:hypothetical protein
MTVDRTGLAAGVSLGASTLEVEILAALLQVRNSDAHREGDGYRKKQVAAILRAVAESEMLQRHLTDEDAEYVAMVGDAAAAVATHLGEVERPTTRLEDDILTRLRAVPTREALSAHYEDARDAERVRRRALIGAVLDATTNNTFMSEPSDEFIIDPDDADSANRQDFAVARQDLLQDCARMDIGLKATHCMVEADRLQNDLTPAVTQRDALLWAMVAIDTGSYHPKYRTQEVRCGLAVEFTGLSPRTLGQYLKELRRDSRPQKKAKFSEAERQLFHDRSARVRKTATYRGAGWDLVLPVLRGWSIAALPKPTFKNRVQKRKVTPEV